jgi:hypothetical protein
MQASQAISAFRYLNGKKVPAKPPPDHHYGKPGVAVVHDSRDKVTKRRNDVWAKSAKDPERHSRRDYA